MNFNKCIVKNKCFYNGFFGVNVRKNCYMERFFYLKSMFKVFLRDHFYVTAITIKRLCLSFIKDSIVSGIKDRV